MKLIEKHSIRLARLNQTTDTKFKASSPEKISKQRHSAWSLPPGPDYSCPGATDACNGCYAMKGRHVFSNVIKPQMSNWNLLKEYEKNNQVKEAANAIKSILKQEAKIFRVHESGDFHSQFSVDTWNEVIQMNPHISFWAYTRSFNLDYSNLLKNPNFNLWVSTDQYNKNNAAVFAQKFGLKQAYGPFPHNMDKPANSFFCPATIKRNGRPLLEGPGQCEKCKLCITKDRTKKNVVFLEH